MALREEHPEFLVDDTTGKMGFKNKVSGKDVTLDDPSSVAITGGTVDGQPIPLTAQLPNWRKAVAKVIAGTANGRVLCIGDSTTIGYAGGSSVGQKNGSWPYRLASMLSSMGVPTSTQSTFGESGAFSSVGTNDTRIVLGDWSFNGQWTIGGQAFVATATTTNPLTFTPTGNTDTCEVYYFRGTTGTLNLSVDAGATTPVATNGASSLIKYSLAGGALGVHAYKAAWGGAISGNQGVYVAGFIAYDSTTKAVQIINAGVAGVQTATVFNNPFASFANQISVIAPDLTIIQLGINDWINSTSVAGMTTALQGMVAAALAVGDCVVVSPVASNPASYSAASQAPYIAACKAVAAQYGVPYIDQNYRLGSYAQIVALGFGAGDGVHLSTPGYADEARPLFRLLNV